MKKLKLFALTAVALMGASGVANAETAMLASDDFRWNFILGDFNGDVSSYCFLFLRKWKCCSRMENINNRCWSSNWYCLYTLHVYERCMGYQLVSHQLFTDILIG